MAPGYLLQRPIVPETKKIRTLLPGFGFFYGHRSGGGSNSGRSSAKLRAYGEEYTPCAMATLLVATRRSERWESHFSVIGICGLTYNVVVYLAENIAVFLYYLPAIREYLVGD